MNKPTSFVNASNPFGTTDDAIRSGIIKKFHDNNIKVLISAFGATDHPTTN
jgi:hypothetical protein